MKILEILQKNKGTYAAVRFDKDTTAALAKYIVTNDLPNPISEDKMHCTLLYSRKFCPNYIPRGKIDPPWIGKPTKLEVWESRGDEPKRCLVMKFKCKQLHDRHKELMEEHKATYDFPEYKTHVTLSYDIGDMDGSELPDISQAIKELKIVKEYGEDLVLNWAENNTGK